MTILQATVDSSSIGSAFMQYGILGVLAFLLGYFAWQQYLRLVKTIIHEYTHYVKHSMHEYQILAKYLPHHQNPLEKDALRVERRDYKKCLRFLKKEYNIG